MEAGRRRERAGVFAAALVGLFVGCNTPTSPPHAAAVPLDGGAGSGHLDAAAHGGASGQGGPSVVPPEKTDAAVGVDAASSGGSSGASGGSSGAASAAGGATGAAGSASGFAGGHAASSTDATDPTDAGSGEAGDPPCTPNVNRCSEGCVETCQSDGTWGPPVTCTGHRTCTGTIGEARCVCKEDRACFSTVGTTCTSQGTMATCTQDELGCFYETVPIETCDTGACLGAPGAATCCKSSCETNPTRCESGSTLGTCSLISSGCATFAPSACASGTVCERTALPACVDPAWAEWPMPNGAADVTGGAPNPASFVDNRDGTFTDRVTGLMWEQLGHVLITFAEASAYCQTKARLGGYTDWRVPSLIELISIADFTRLLPSIDPTIVPPGWDNWRWSTTTRNDASGAHYAINFFRGDVNTRADGEVFGPIGVVQCVR